MTRYRQGLPQLSDTVFLTDDGLETFLIFLEGVDLPCLASFPLLTKELGRQLLLRYFEPYLRIAQDRNVGFLLDTVELIHPGGGPSERRE